MVPRAEKMYDTAPQIVNKPLDKTLVDLLVLIGIPVNAKSYTESDDTSAFG